MMYRSPSAYDLPHDAWRPGQQEALDRLLAAGKDSVTLLEAPTGSGKTAIARAVGSQRSVTALCRTKVLQRENYEEGYGFDALFGRGNYPCALDPQLTGSECEYAENGSSMKDCPSAGECEYLKQKAVVMHSSQRALNYAYWLTARWPRLAATDAVFCDEAHMLSDIVLDHCGATVMEKQRQEWDLPKFPVLNSHSGSVLTRVNPVEEAIGWLSKAREMLLRHYYALDKQKDDKKVLRKLRQCERLGLKLRATMDALKDNASDWYIVSGPQARSFMGRQVPGFVCRPLTARHHAPTYFLNGWQTVMMSATIGDKDTFAQELGIAQYGGWTVSSSWPPESRPVFVPRDAPRMGQKAKREGPKAYEKQADLIAELLRSVPATWSGVIHHTSIKEAKFLAGRLASRGFGSRIWLPPEKVGTEEQMAAWMEYRSRVSNALAVTWSWHTGIDLLDERICIVAKVAFPFLGDRYEKARLSFDGKLYSQRAAWTLEQACGRTRRGRAQDYDTEEEKRGLVAVVDGNYKRIEKYLSPAFVESIVEV